MNKNLLKSFVGVIALGALFTVNVALALNNTGTVNATVMLQQISLSVADGSISYGTLGFNSTQNTLAGTGGLNADAGDQQVATNDGNVNEDFNIKGNASTNWTLGASAGSDIYAHEYCTSGCGTWASPIRSGTGGTKFSPLSSSGYSVLGTNIAPAGTKAFDLLVNTPTTSAILTSQSVNVTVQAVAH